MRRRAARFLIRVFFIDHSFVIRHSSFEFRHYPMALFSKTLDKLKTALKKTAAVLNTDVRTLFVPGRQIDDAWLAEMEEKFIRADIGVRRAEQLKNEVRQRWRLGGIRNADEAESIVRE